MEKENSESIETTEKETAEAIDAEAIEEEKETEKEISISETEKKQAKEEAKTGKKEKKREQKETILSKAIKKIKAFLEQSKRILVLSKKPDSKEFRSIAKITGIGIILIGVIGFIIRLAFFFIGFNR